MSTLKVEIVTPERIRLDDVAQTVVLPGVEGQMGILAGHAPMLALLEPGITVVRQSNGDQTFATGTGFVKINENRATVLVDFAEAANEVNLDAARKQRDEVRRALAGTLTVEQRDEQMLALRAAEARLKVAGAT